MDKATYQHWWQLHLRVARGNSLNPAEKSSYDDGRQELEREEHFRETTDLKESREELLALEAEHAVLESQRKQLDAEISELESRLSEQTRQFLGVED